MIGSLCVLLAVGCALSLLWNMPAFLEGLAWHHVAPVSLEIVLAFALMSLVPRLRDRRAGTVAALFLALATTLIVVLKAGELTIIQVLDRPFNPLLDVRLVPAAYQLLTEILPGGPGLAACVGLALMPLVIGSLCFAAVRRVQRMLEHNATRRAALAAWLALAGLFGIQQAAGAPYSLVATDATVALLRYARAAEETARGIAQVEREIADDRFTSLPADQMLAGLQRADVLLLFVESYGRSALEMPRYEAATSTALDEFAERLAERHLASVSGWLTSPTVGGQSWLPTATFNSGLWLADQGRYDVAMQSARLTLVRAFDRAGYRTVALKPAITAPWPESAGLGYAQVYDAADLGYAGKPYNWVTMPDQYTLSVLQRAEQRRAAQPLFAEVSLISSHSPWTPVARVVEDWSSIGDGRIFSMWADEGDPPEVVWSDPERVRSQYGRAIDYVLRVLSSYTAHFVERGALLIIVGDHQPPPLITGDDAGRDVPVHVISGNPDLLAPFTAWGFTPGMRPARDAPPRRMDAFRDFFLEAFSRAASPRVEADND